MATDLIKESVEVGRGAEDLACELRRGGESIDGEREAGEEEELRGGEHVSEAAEEQLAP